MSMLERQSGAGVQFSHAAYSDFPSPPGSKSPESKSIVPEEIAAKLSPRQNLILEYIMTGLSDMQIMSRLSLAHTETALSIAGVYGQLKASNRIELFNEIYGDVEARDVIPLRRKYRLGHQEVQAVKLMLDGQNPRMIAEITQRQLADVKARIANIFMKMDVDSEAAFFATAHAVIQTSVSHQYNTAIGNVNTLTDEEKRSLNQGEQDVYELRKAGLTYNVIGDRLGISRNTVADRLKHIHIKLGLSDGSHSVLAQEYGDVYPAQLDAAAQAFGLTRTEKKVLGNMMSGFTNKKIGDVLGISEHTVNDHTKSIFRKTGTHSRQEVCLAVHGHLKNQTQAEDLSSAAELSAG
jgi:DNA-binding NarL/FixJ family response regulator